jgi:hypothetical protein
MINSGIGTPNSQRRPYFISFSCKFQGAYGVNPTPPLQFRDRAPAEGVVFAASIAPVPV